jgi:ribosomal subunit interface protein
MNIVIKSTNLELTPALRDYTEKRLRSIVKYTGGDATITVEIGKTTAHHKQGEVFLAEVHVLTPLGKQHHAASEKGDLYEAIDDVRNEIVRELASAKGKRETLFRRGAQKVKWMMRGFRD